MSMDKRIETKHRPMYGCHSELDHHRKTPAPECDVYYRAEENACDGCKRREAKNEPN